MWRHCRCLISLFQFLVERQTPKAGGRGRIKRSAWTSQTPKAGGRGPIKRSAGTSVGGGVGRRPAALVTARPGPTLRGRRLQEFHFRTFGSFISAEIWVSFPSKIEFHFHPFLGFIFGWTKSKTLRKPYFLHTFFNTARFPGCDFCVKFPSNFEFHFLGFGGFISGDLGVPNPPIWK